MRPLLRLADVGVGLRVRDCVLCGCKSASVCQIMGERVLTFWGHLDTDGISCLGYADWICVGVLRRRWKKWKLNELAAHFKDNLVC